MGQTLIMVWFELEPLKYIALVCSKQYIVLIQCGRLLSGERMRLLTIHIVAIVGSSGWKTHSLADCVVNCIGLCCIVNCPPLFSFLLSHVNYVPCSILCHHCSLPIVLSYLVSSRATFSTGATLSTLHISKHLYALLAPQGSPEAKMRHVVSTFKYILYWLPPQTQLHNAKSNVM